MITLLVVWPPTQQHTHQPPHSHTRPSPIASGPQHPGHLEGLHFCRPIFILHFAFSFPILPSFQESRKKLRDARLAALCGSPASWSNAGKRGDENIRVQGRSPCTRARGLFQSPTARRCVGVPSKRKPAVRVLYSRPSRTWCPWAVPAVRVLY